MEEPGPEEKKPCAICGAPSANRWTIDAPAQVVIAHLCADHEQPLYAVIGQIQEHTPEAVTIVHRKKVIRRKGPKPFRTLDNWTPPTHEDEERPEDEAVSE